MELDIFFSPINEFAIEKESIGENISSYFKDKPFPKWENADVVLFGVQESRNSHSNKGCSHGQNKIRESFYKLNSNFEFNVTDLGDIQKGDSVEDTYIAVSEVVKDLVSNGKFVIILGGSQDITYANYLGYEKLEQTVNVVSIDDRLDISTDEKLGFSSLNYLNKIVLHQPNYLFNLSQLGYQGYYVKKSQIKLLEDLYFEYLRLGELQDDISLAEPVLRNADILSIDLKALRRSEFCAAQNVGPNGFFANEMCQLMKYAGISDKLSSVGVYDYDHELDFDGSGAELVAQMIYFLIDGFYSRKGDYPSGLKADNIKYVVHHGEIDHNLIFYKSPKSDRWWLEVPYPPRNDFKFERHHLVPCSYVDYQEAMNENIPDVWWKTYRKLN
ncbi:MAG: formimidoylglutamase [Flavobacteriales bacterium]|nr:formimidoylglutamase [Flavobacteriales bacterium]